MELQVCPRQVLRYRAIAFESLVEYRSVSKKRNPEYKYRLKGSNKPRQDCPNPGITHYEFWVLKLVRSLMKSMRNRNKVIEYLKSNQRDYSVARYAEIHQLPLLEDYHVKEYE